jgi:YD repeat-containing protein
VIDKVGTNRTHYTRDDNGNLIGQRNPDGTRWYYLKDGLGLSGCCHKRGGQDHRPSLRLRRLGKADIPERHYRANPWGYASGYLDTTGVIKFGTDTTIQTSDGGRNKIQLGEASQINQRSIGIRMSGTTLLTLPILPVASHLLQ